MKTSKKPGTKLIAGGVIALALGVIILMINLTNPVTRYVEGAGMVETQGPSAGSIILIACGLVLAAFGFCRRLLAAVEK